MQRNEEEPAATSAPGEKPVQDRAGQPGAENRPGLQKTGSEGGDERRFQKVLSRIRMVTGTRTQVELAAVLEIRQSSVSDACRRSTVPPQWYLTLLTKLGVNPLWVEHGTEPQYLLGPRRVAVSDEMDACGCLPVSVRSTRCPPPSPTRAPVLSVVGEVFLPSAWLRPSFILLCLEADAGLPHFPRGAYVSVDTACVQPLPGEYYAVFPAGGGVRMTPLRVLADGRYTMDGEAGEVECPSVHVLGRVVWTWRPY